MGLGFGLGIGFSQVIALCDASLLARQAGSRPVGRGTFLCFAKEKYPKERRAGFVDPALRAGHAALLGTGGKRRNSLRSNICASFSAAPCATRLLMTAGDRIPIPKTTRTRRGASLWSSAVWFWAVGSPCRVAGLSSAAAGGSGRALSERSEFSPTPPDASSARYPEGALTSARLSFGYFSLAKQRKVPRLPGRDPACQASQPSRRKELTWLQI